jgi:uncharacterized protein YcbX
LHLVNLASIRAVERQLPKGSPRLSAAHFRANLIITGPEAFHEDSWRRIKIGFYEYDVSCCTTLYKLPSVDPTTGEKRATEPDRTLRPTQAVGAGAGPNPGCLGMQMVPLSKESALRVGDEITVLSMAEHVLKR